jgi:hypothetical protein
MEIHNRAWLALPVARDEAILDLWRPDMDALHVWNLVAAVGATAARFAGLVVMAQTGDQFAL